MGKELLDFVISGVCQAIGDEFHAMFMYTFLSQDRNKCMEHCNQSQYID